MTNRPSHIHIPPPSPTPLQAKQDAEDAIRQEHEIWMYGKPIPPGKTVREDGSLTGMCACVYGRKSNPSARAPANDLSGESDPSSLGIGSCCTLQSLARLFSVLFPLYRESLRGSVAVTVLDAVPCSHKQD